MTAEKQNAVYLSDADAALFVYFMQHHDEIKFLVERGIISARLSSEKVGSLPLK